MVVLLSTTQSYGVLASPRSILPDKCSVPISKKHLIHMLQKRGQLKIYISEVHAKMLDKLIDQGLLGHSRTELMTRAMVDFLLEQSKHNNALQKILDDSTQASTGDE